MDIQEIDIAKMPQRVIRAEYQGKPCYIKKRIACRRTFIHWLQGKIAKVIKDPIFALTVPGPNVNLALYEAEKINVLHRLGLQVPQVFSYSEDYLVIEDCGMRVDHYIRRHIEQGQEVLEKAVRTIAQLHHAGYCHGGSQIRNFTIKEQRVYLIDFEEEIPEDCLGDFAFRDLLLFLQSLADLKDIEFDFKKIVDVYQRESGYPVEERLLAYYRKLRFVRAFQPVSRLMGRDYHAMLFLVNLLQQFERPKELKKGNSSSI